MAKFRTENPNLGNFWRGLAMEDVGTFLWTFGVGILQPFGIFLWTFLWTFRVGILQPFGIFFPRFGMLYQE
jgi:hypothetical protein